MMPFFTGIRLVTATTTANQHHPPTHDPYILALLLHLPTFLLASQYLVADWLDYAVVGGLQGAVVLSGLVVGVENQVVNVRAQVSVLAVLTYLFACNEKSRKESWVISHTNAKTKKILMGLLNQ